MKNNRCIINELSRMVAEDASIKAVWLDSAHKRVSYAFEDGKENKESQQRLDDIISQFKPEEESDCVEETWAKIDCMLCDRGVSQPMPANVKLVTIPGAGIMIQKKSISTLHCTWRWQQKPWIHIKPRQFTLPNELTNLSEWKKQLIFAIICGALTLISFILDQQSKFLPALLLPQGTSYVLYFMAYIAGAYFPIRETFELLRKGILDVHFLMICVALGAAIIGHWWEGATLLFLFSLSGALEEMAMANTEREIKGLFKQAPKTAQIIKDNGEEETIKIEELKVGMLLRVRPGEQFPVDSRVIAGTSAANESNLTGESLPVDKKKGDTVLSGTINLWGIIECRVIKLASESMLAKIINLIEQAQESKAPSQRFTDKFSTGYTYAILGMSVLMFFIWWLVLHISPFVTSDGTNSAFYRAMTLLVVASPCALVLSIPSAILAGIAAGAKNGVLFRGGVAIEKLAEVNRVALDKTGTLTLGELKILKINVSSGVSDAEFLKVIASVCFLSTHPVSLAIKKNFTDQGGDLLEVKDFQSLSGQGLEGVVIAENGEQIKLRLGRRSMFKNLSWVNQFAVPEIGITELLVDAGKYQGQVLLLDSVREASAPLLKELQSSHIKVSMLTGDNSQAASLIAKQVGITDVHASLLPEAKVKLIQDWQTQGQKVAMVGDGVNDAASLAASHVGVGMGLRGSDAVLEQADVVLIKDRLENFIFAFKLSQKARRIIKQNLFISLGVIIILVLSALGSVIPLTIGVIGHEGSTVIVVLNSLRLLMFSPNKK